MLRRWLPVWSWLAPLAGWLLWGAVELGFKHPLFIPILGLALVSCVIAAVHHAEVVAHRVGEPYGALLLALAVTVIEVALVVALMIAGGPDTVALARDTVFAEVMIIVNGVVGLCLVLGGTRHREQSFGLYGVSAALATLATLSVMTLVLPNATTTTPGPVYAPSQLAFVGVVSLVLYLVFVFVQTVRHRDYFLLIGPAANDEGPHTETSSIAVAIASALVLLACLGAVVLLAEALAPAVEAAVDRAGAPRAVVGVIIGAVVLLPESLAALRAAFDNRLQTSLNLALGSALASIGLTIPAVAGVALVEHWTLVLGLDFRSMILLGLSLLVATLSLGTGRTTVLQGAVHLVIFAVYLFTTIVP